MKRVILSSICLTIILIGCGKGGFVRSKPTVSKDHISSLLNQLSATFVEDKQQIVDMSVKAQNILKNEGVQESLINIMEGMNQLFPRKIENQVYSETVPLYIALRTKGLSHTEAIRGLQALLQDLQKIRGAY